MRVRERTQEMAIHSNEYCLSVRQQHRGEFLALRVSERDRSDDEFVDQPCSSIEEMRWIRTGRLSHRLSTPSSYSHVSAPIDGNIEDATWRMASRYVKAI